MADQQKQEYAPGVQKVREDPNVPSHPPEQRPAVPMGLRGTGGETGNRDSDNP